MPRDIVTIGFVIEGDKKKVVAFSIGPDLARTDDLPAGVQVRQLDLSSCLSAGATLGLLDTPLGRKFLEILVQAVLNVDVAPAAERAA